MSLKRLPPALCVLAVCLLCVPAGWAAPPRYGGGFRTGYEFNFNLPFFMFQDKAGIEDDIGFGFRFGYLYNTTNEIEFLFDTVRADDTDQVLFPGEYVDTTNLQVAYVHNFSSHGVVPYLTAGGGFVFSDDSSPALGDETDLVLGLGGGARFFIGRVAYFRAELRGNFFEGGGDVYSNGENFVFTELSFGMGWRFPTH